jgi:hypothetical protein
LEYLLVTLVRLNMYERTLEDPIKVCVFFSNLGLFIVYFFFLLSLHACNVLLVVVSIFVLLLYDACIPYVLCECLIVSFPFPFWFSTYRKRY